MKRIVINACGLKSKGGITVFKKLIDPIAPELFFSRRGFTVANTNSVREIRVSKMMS